MSKLICMLVVVAVAGNLTGCISPVAIGYVVMGAKQAERNQGRSEDIDFAYASDKVIVGTTTKADITKYLGEPNQVIQDANEVWKYEKRVLLGLGSGSAGDSVQVFVAFNNEGLVSAIAGSDAKLKKVVRFAKGDLHLLPLMAGQSVNRTPPLAEAPVPAHVADSVSVAPVADPTTTVLKKVPEKKK